MDTTDEIIELGKLFKSIDENKDGLLSKDEIIKGVESIGLNFPFDID